MPSKAEVLLPLYISCLAAGSLLEKKKKKPTLKEGHETMQSKTHIWVHHTQLKKSPEERRHSCQPGGSITEEISLSEGA